MHPPVCWGRLSYFRGFVRVCVHVCPCVCLSKVHARVRGNLLVVQHNVGQPDVLGRNVQLGDAAVLVRIPFQLVVLPFLRRAAVWGWAVTVHMGYGFVRRVHRAQGALANYVI